MAITLYQEQRSERALEALRDLSSPKALVVRDYRQKRIPGREVVRGDLLVLSEGDRVPVDAVAGEGLRVIGVAKAEFTPTLLPTTSFSYFISPFTPRAPSFLLPSFRRYHHLPCSRSAEHLLVRGNEDMQEQTPADAVIT